jgi:hypothetical protein
MTFNYDWFTTSKFYLVEIPAVVQKIINVFFVVEPIKVARLIEVVFCAVYSKRLLTKNILILFVPQ